jgi:putative colanic acid biosynthesis UDP-glucose lipid carrier transferase
MHRQLTYYLKSLLFIIDIIVLNITFLITLYFASPQNSFIYNDTYKQYLIFQNLSWFLVAYIVGVYSSIILKYESFIKRTFQVFIVWQVVNLFFLVFSKELSFPRTFIFFSLFNISLGLVLNRFLYLGLRNYITMHQHNANKVIIIGYNETAKRLAKYFEEEDMHTELVGYVDNEDNVHELSNYPVYTEMENVVQFASGLNVSEIFSTISPEQQKSIYDIMEQAESKCMRFKVVPNLSYFLHKPVVVDYIRDLPILSIRKDPLEDMGNQFKKRVFDVIVSALVVVFVLSWLVPLIGLLIVLESPGPIFFTQWRTGRRDKPFKCLKFRSMRMNNENESKQATKNDWRCTRIGSFLRKTSLDEFPQFINVLHGDMSLVGPRPHMIKHTSDFSKLVDHYMARQLLKPGITGWAQIHSYRGEITNPIQLQMRISSDLWYLENWTIWLDIRIMFLTVYQVFAGDKNAY